MDPGPLRDLLTVVLGTATGALSGLLGVGGAAVSTPGIRALGASALVAVGTTLPSIIPGAATGSVRYHREGLIDGRVLAWSAPFGIVASVFGSLLSEKVPGDGHLLMLGTAAIIGWSAWHLRRPPIPVVAGNRGPARPAATCAGVGLLAGLLSGLLGLGGGIVMVPGFSQLVRLDLKQAIATSLACVALFAIPGTITHAALGNVDWRFALFLAVGVVPGALLGAGLTVRAEERGLRIVVAGLLGLTAVVYAVGELAALAS